MEREVCSEKYVLGGKWVQVWLNRDNLDEAGLIRVAGREDDEVV